MKVLTGKILLSAVPGGPIGAFPATPTVAGLYVGATHFGFHDGTNWITYTDIAGKAMWEGIGGDSGHVHWDPASGGSLDIKGVVTITAGSTGVGNLGDAGDLAVLNVVGTAQIENLAVIEAKIANLAVTNAKIGDLAVGTGEIANLAVTEGKIANLAVTEAKIANLTVTGAKIADATIADAKITGTITVGHTDAKCTDPNADQTSAHPQAVSWLTDAGAMAYEDLVEKAKLGTTIITGGYLKTDLLSTTNAYITATAQIANLVVTGAKIANLTVTEGKIANLAVTNAKIGNLAVGTGEIANLAVTEGKIANLSVTDAKIANATITYAKIVSVNAATITAGIITAICYQTASSGEAIRIHGSGALHKIQVISSVPDLRVEMSADGVFARNLGGWSAANMCTLRYMAGRFTHSGSQVFSGTAPTGWTNLNLSSIVGSRRALVILRVYNGTGTSRNYRFRPDGDSVVQGASVDLFPGLFSTKARGSSDSYNYVMCETGTNGYVEWICGAAATTTVVLMAYIS